MINFESAHKYLGRVSPQSPPILKQMEEYARRHDFPIIGPLVGRLMYQLAAMTKAKKILELGSGYGYSAYWFALAAGRKGKLILTDNDENNKIMAMEYLKKAGIKSKIDFRVGEALNIAHKLNGKFDIVFNDIDKIHYPKTVKVAARLLKKGGLFITDNLLAGGLVYSKSPKIKGRAVRSFTDNLYSDKRFFTTIIPLRDGVSVAIRK